jgi:hypothetical protein
MATLKLSFDGVVDGSAQTVATTIQLPDALIRHYVESHAMRFGLIEPVVKQRPTDAEIVKAHFAHIAQEMEMFINGQMHRELVQEMLAKKPIYTLTMKPE